MDAAKARQVADQSVGLLVDAWNAHDADAFAQAFNDDAEFTNVFGMTAFGRDEIGQFHAPIFQTMFSESTLEALDIRTKTIRGDVIAVDVHWAMRGARDPHGAPWPERRGLMSLVCTNDGEHWGIATMHNLDLPDTAMAQAQEVLQST